ncbi:mitochondrial 37S ribosomal protein rsm10 [Mortierella polycephala]|uniref:Small ribosomal subunit protein uS10m n=1 Tax=Mortierella polycephala TaxID=41804 RepID=A0A9P6Q1S8_9FUNG|nr:mitochondrial 37S ribosomal protein rsm10 [Mortierella polycephala]
MLSTLKTGLSARGLNAVKVASVASRSISAVSTLPEDMSLEDRLVYGQPVQIPTTHNITVAHLHLRSYLPNQLEFFTDFARRAAAALEMPCSGAIPLPVQTSKWTVNKSPFVHKKAQETFERKTHKRLLAIKDSHPDVVRRWVQFLNQNSLGGVGMRVTIWENEELGIGQKRMDRVKKGENRNMSVASAAAAMNAEQAFGTVQLDEMTGGLGQEPSKEVKAVADQLLAEMMKDIGGEEEISHGDDNNAMSSSSQESDTPSSSSSSSDAPENPDQPTESIIAEAVEPLVSSSPTLNPELSETVEKAIADSTTKTDKH